jgi:hypothetical protein
LSVALQDPAAFWNARFDAQPRVYGAAPNAWLVECEPALPRGARVLCLAEGQDRNALWLAKQGHRVHAVDVSAVALGQLAAAASDARVSIGIEVADLADWQPEVGAYDAVVLVFAHFPPALRAQVHAAAAVSLNSGGVLVLEGFAREQLGRTSGGPKELDWLFDEALLRDDFACLRFERLYTLEDSLDEGPFHQGPAVRVRGLARA